MAEEKIEIKKILCLLTILLLSAGCMQAIEQATGLQLSKAVNPVMELEMDLVFLDEIAAMTKLNQMLLDRVPISLEDPWPDLLNSYSEDPSEKDKAARKKYDVCLTNLLKNDFYFFKFYNPALYFGYVGPGGVNALLSRAIIAARATLIIAAAKEMGRHYEHAKSVVSYYPFGCKCAYYEKGWGGLQPGSSECRQVSIDEECTFFNLPTEETLNQYIFEDRGLNTWVDLKTPLECLRVVEGERLGTFKEVFYTLLPDHIRDAIKRVDDEVQVVEADLEEIKARLNEKELSQEGRARLEKREEELEKEVDIKTGIQQKLYKEATSTVEVTSEKVKKAKKLLNVANYINEGFSQISAAMIALTVKMVDDVLIFAQFNTYQIANSMGYLAAQGIASGPDVRKRGEILAKRFAGLFMNYPQVWGNAISQKYQVSIYFDYLESLVKMERKLKG